MATYSTTKLSSKGQVVIPEKVRDELGLNEGDQFVVVGRGDTVVLKIIAPPSATEFDELLRHARAEARSIGIKRTGIKAATTKVRRRAK